MKSIYVIALAAALSTPLYAAPMNKSDTSHATGIWTSVQGNPAHTGYVNIEIDPAKLHQLWIKQLYKNDQRMDEGPSIGGAIITTNQLAYFDVNYHYFVPALTGKVTSAGERQLLAVDQNTGKIMWKLKRDPSMDYTSLAYDNHKILSFREIADDVGVDVIQPATGAIDFTIPLPRGNYHTDGFLADQGKMYPSYYHYRNSSHYQLDSTTGKIDWTAPLANDVGFTQEVAVTTPAYIVYSKEDGISVYDKKTGQFTFDIKSANFYKHQFVTYHQPAPVYDAANNVVYETFRYAPYGEAVVAAFDLTAKKIKWVSALHTGFGFLALADHELFVESGSGGAVGNSLQSMDPATGNINWTWTPDNNEKLYARSFPLVTANLVFVQGQKKTYAISRTTHQKVWETDITGKMALGDHTLLIMSETYHPSKKNPEYVVGDGLSVTAFGF